MQAPRSLRQTELMPSQASQLPQKSQSTGIPLLIYTTQVGYQAAVLCF